jgi:hypothetical protein
VHVEKSNTVYEGNFQALSQNFMKRLSALSYLAIRLFVHMEKLGPQWKEFHEI